MKAFDYVITDEVGIHARPAGILAKKIAEFQGTMVKITKGEKTAEARRLMAVMGLGVKKGDTVTVTIEGGDEDAAAAAIEEFFKANF